MVRVIKIEKNGGPEVLQIKNIEVPELKSASGLKYISVVCKCGVSLCTQPLLKSQSIF